jgi:hypothetical protein
MHARKARHGNTTEGSHTGGGSSKVEANMALVINPSAWHSDFGAISLSDVWSWLCPCVLMIQCGLLFYFFPIFLDFSIEVLFAAAMMMWEQGVAIFAPLLWMVALLFTFWLGKRKAPSGEPEPRWKCRNRAQHVRRHAHKGFGSDPGSIKTHHFHRKYPLSLRGLGHFVRNPPPVDQQHLITNLHRLSGELQSHLVHISRLLQPHSNPQIFCRDPRPAVTCRKGGMSRSKKVKQCKKKGGVNPIY